MVPVVLGHDLLRDLGHPADGDLGEIETRLLVFREWRETRAELSPELRNNSRAPTVNGCNET